MKYSNINIQHTDPIEINIFSDDIHLPLKESDKLVKLQESDHDNTVKVAHNLNEARKAN